MNLKLRWNFNSDLLKVMVFNTDVCGTYYTNNRRWKFTNDETPPFLN